MSHLKRMSNASLLSRQLGLTLNYTGSLLERTEQGLEKEIRRESFVPPRKNKIARLRHDGELVLHSKQVLMLIVVLNLVDCCLVLGELILDIHYIKGLRDKTEERSQKFVDTMVKRYPDDLSDFSTDNLDDLYAHLYTADCRWTPRVDVMYMPGDNITLINGTFQPDVGAGNASRLRKSADHPTLPPHPTASNILRTIPETVYETRQPSLESHGTHGGSHGTAGHSVWEDVAHGLHKASITILGILFFESILKIICMGKEFLSKKLEVFDTIVVIVSFVVDVVLLRGLTHYKVQDALLILSFLLPWRVIRVVNSLIVAVLDHEHFRLKMLYKEKKMISAQLERLEETEKRWDFHLQKIESFCESEGIPKWKIRQHTALGRKQSTITTMASLALCGMLPGIIMGPADKKMFNRIFEQNANAHAKNDAPKTNNATIKALVSATAGLKPIRINKNPSVPVINLDIIDESVNSDDEDSVDFQESVTGSGLNLSVNGNNFYKTPRQSIQSDPGHGVLNLPKGSFAAQKRVSFDHMEIRPLLTHQTSVCSEYTDAVENVETQNDNNVPDPTHPVKFDNV
ncbi:uncharacterized protein LOC127864617 [Dreissena polymorpha]|uniref:uncharacterized protein LOC127864617 n=1 Tax=Dreissena polymorpha TaxID=45954 RepID=UPI002264B5D2|nr:uncharacterized protein LOC127864617 [Dreissena polymorpha]